MRLEKRGGAPKGKGPFYIFRTAVTTWPEVVTCYAMTGEMDYLPKVFVEDMEHFARFIRDRLFTYLAVIDVKSSFALERVKDTTALPVVV